MRIYYVSILKLVDLEVPLIEDKPDINLKS